jgi:hypothetical protein
MNIRCIFKIGLFFVLAFVLTACDGRSTSGGPYVWIDVPTDGLQVPLNQPVRIEGHASYSGGIARVEIWANGELHLVQENPPAQGNLAHFDQSWMPPGAGEYIVEVKAVGADGAESVPDIVRLYVGEAVAEVTPTHTPPPTLGSTEVVEPTAIVTPTLEVTETPSATATIPPATRPPTSTPTPTPTPTSPPPEAIIEFGASAGEINAGECAKLLWHAENVKAVFLDGEGVVGRGSKEVCPCKDTTYVLSVTLLDDTETERSFTLRVKGSCVTPTPTPTPTPTTEPDTTAPPVPPVISPTGGASLDCDKVTLDWNAVSDPSGIAEYRVQVEQEVTPGNWEKVSGSPWNGLSETELDLNLDVLVCGGVYRWRVKAVDGAGNESAFSAWAEFGINLP